MSRTISSHKGEIISTKEQLKKELDTTTREARFLQSRVALLELALEKIVQTGTEAHKSGKLALYSYYLGVCTGTAVKALQEASSLGTVPVLPPRKK